MRLIVEHIDKSTPEDLALKQKQSTAEIIPFKVDPNSGIILRRIKGLTSVVILQEPGQSGTSRDLVVSIQTDRHNGIIEKRQVFIPPNSGKIQVNVPELRSEYIITY